LRLSAGRIGDIDGFDLALKLIRVRHDDEQKVKMPARTARTLKSKLFKITASIMLVMTVVTLSAVAWMNYATENDRLAESEQHIRRSIWSKGSTLAESHAMALKPLVTDNAFSDVRSLVSRAVEKKRALFTDCF
jgi:hypothetical protein